MSFIKLTQRINRKSQIYNCLSQYFFGTATYKGKPYYDIVISGCGPVGAGFACALSNSPYFQRTSKDESKSILILDNQKPPKVEEVSLNQTPDQRVYSISGSSQKFLQSIGAWNLLDHNRIGKTEQMQVWESNGQGYLKFHLQENQQDSNLGLLMENNNIVAAIVKRLEELDQVEFAIPDSIEKFEDSQENDNIQLIQLKSGKQVYARLVVGSDGRYSAVKEKKGIPTYGWMYNQMGVVCSIKTTKATKNTAYQRYLEGGPLAILPLWDDYSSIVWSVPPYQYEELMKLSDEQFLNELNHALCKPSVMDTPTLALTPEANKSDFTSPPIVTQICNKRLAFPLAQLQSRRYIDQNVALIGDAAHSIHPHAGQGVNMGFNDAVTLANIVIKNKRVGHNIGDIISLQEYENQAKLFNYANAISMELIKKMYELPGPFAFIRNVGANIINNNSFLKENFMKVASHHPLAPSSYEWESQN
ncbi:hypothetical protein ABPG74_013548 [Tetrahymena malaccensis]